MSTGVIIALWIVVFVVVSGFAAMLFITYPISKKVYEDHLVRNSDDKWGRVCSAPDNEEQIEMWNTGIEWAKQNKEFMTEVSIENEGLTLYGEYYDFGSDTCAVILPGRCECLVYSYYFAKPYKDAGQNVLVIDTRCHGKSDGKYSSIGLYESHDLKAWMKFIQNKYGIKGFWLHGICVGSNTVLMVASDKTNSASVDGVVLEGCYINFRESFKQHMIDKKKPVFPVLDLVMLHIWRYAKSNVYKNTPLKLVKNISCPILFLFGEKDIFSLPPKSRKLYNACASNNKKLEWFSQGSHSHLRINNTEKYDTVIKDFVGEYEKR